MGRRNVTILRSDTTESPSCCLALALGALSTGGVAEDSAGVEGEAADGAVTLVLAATVGFARATGAVEGHGAWGWSLVGRLGAVSWQRREESRSLVSRRCSLVNQRSWGDGGSVSGGRGHLMWVKGLMKKRSPFSPVWAWAERFSRPRQTSMVSS